MPWSKYFSLIWGQPHIAVIQTETCGIEWIRAVGFVDNWQLLRKMQCRTSFRKITQTLGALKSDLEIFREAGVCRQLNGRLSLPRHSHWSHSTDSLKGNDQTASNYFAVAKTCRSVSPGRGEGTRAFAIWWAIVRFTVPRCVFCLAGTHCAISSAEVHPLASGAEPPLLRFTLSVFWAPSLCALGGFRHKRRRKKMLQCGTANFLTGAPLGQGP